MKATVTLSLDVPSIQKATAIREKLARHLDADEEVTLIASSSALEDEEFTVAGSYRGNPDEVWREVVRATDREAAVEVALKTEEKRTVVAVLDGDVEIG